MILILLLDYYRMQEANSEMLRRQRIKCVLMRTQGSVEANSRCG